MEGCSGALLAFVLTGWMFLLRFMGAGDVKLLMAVGAWVGPRPVVETLVLAVGFGAVMAIVQLASRGKLGDFVRKIQLGLASFAREEFKALRPSLDRTMTLPFGVPLAAAAILTVWVRPLANVQLLPWI